MKWLQNFWDNKKARYITIAIFVVVCAIGIVFASVVLMRQHYKQALTSWHHDLQASFESSGKKIKENKNPAATLTTLDEVQKQLNLWLIPQAPNLLGIPVAANKTRQINNEARSQAAKISGTIENIKAGLNYQATVTAQLAVLSGKSAENLEQLKKLEGEWRTATKTITEVKPPQQLQSFHQSLTKTLDGTVADLAALTSLFEKRDSAGFEAKKEELNNKINTLQNLGDQFANLMKTQDIELSKQMHELDHKLSAMTL